MSTFIPDYRITRRLEALVLRVAKHWAIVDAKLPAEFPVVVLDGMELAEFLALPAAQETVYITLNPLDMDLKLALSSLKKAKELIRNRMQWFRQYMRGFYMNSPFLAGLDVLPDLGDGPDEFLPPIVSTMFLWERIALEPPPVANKPPVMADGYTAAHFAAELAALDGAYGAVRRVKLSQTLARSELLVINTRAAAAIQAYGHAARSRLMPLDPLLASIPRLWPVKQGE